MRVRLILVVVFLWCQPGWCGSADGQASPEDTALALQRLYEQTSSFEADFQQTTTTGLSRRARQGRGSMVIKKPGLMRWDYLEPDRQVLICDGRKVTMYFAQAAQMMVMEASDYLDSDVTYSFFAGTGDLLRDFRVKGGEDDQPDGPQLILLPRRPHPQVESIALWINAEGFVEKMRIVDHFESVTELSFSRIRRNIEVRADRFSFVPPAGTEVIEQ